jgi:hypothetical protein
MNTYDTYSPEHPANEQELQFNSTDLHECLDYFEEMGDIEPLRTAISINADRIREVKKLLKANTENGIATICLKILK